MKPTPSSVRAAARALLLPAVLAAALPAAARAEGAFAEWGARPVPDRDSAWTFSYGSALSLSGSVRETFRAYYKASGQDAKQALAESYDLDDFGIKAPLSAWGLRFEHAWRFAALRFGFSWIDASFDAKAKRDYYIGLEDDVSYGGRSYGHMKIPSGSGFSTDFQGGLADLTVAVTPVSFEPDPSVRIVPEIDVGLIAAVGEYGVHAGPARGTAVYQNPPVDFVVGGSSSSVVGAGSPFVGAGAELRVGPDDWAQWVTRANAGFFSWSGSTKTFTGASHRAKDLDLDILLLTLDTGLVLPMDERTCFTLGVRLRFLSFDGSIRSKDRDTAAILAARERFDKEVDIDMVTGAVYAGITF